MSLSIKHLILTGVLFLSFHFSLIAQWSNDPSVNLTVCDTTGEQALAKIAVTPNGETYISWFDNRSGNYAVYLQRLDQSGNKMWDTNGLLVSGNPQSSSLVDYDLIVDSDDNAVIVFTDTRNAGNLNVFAYRISPSGDFLWGADGASLSASTDYQPNPRVTQTADGNFVVAWIVAVSPSKVALQKLSPAGNKLWGNDPILLSSTTVGYNHPFVVPTDSNGVLVLHTEVTGSFPAQTVKLRATKVSENGTVGWMKSIQDLGTIAAFTVPKVYSDKNNGAIIAWHDDRDMNNLQSAFVQRISASGDLYFPVDGAEASTLAGNHKFNPVASIDPVTEEVYVFWRETNSTQNQNGITGQKLSTNGTRQWTDIGKVFKNLSSPNTSSISSLNARMGNGKAYLFYLEGNGSGLNQVVEGFATDADGNFIWPGNFVTLSNATQEKLQMVSDVDGFFNCKLAWGDLRTASRGIYAQDINPNGQLGNPVIPVELVSFIASVSMNNVNLKWTVGSEVNNAGFEIERKVFSLPAGQTGPQSAVSNFEFERIGFVDGKGTTTESTTYSFVDNNVTPGSYKYRIKQIDFDGSFEYYNLAESVEVGVPNRFELSQNYPNPFNPTTTISWQAPVSGKHTIKVYDVVGNEIATLLDKVMEAGYHSLEFNAANFASGVYYCRLQADNNVQLIKMILLK